VNHNVNFPKETPQIIEALFQKFSYEEMLGIWVLLGKALVNENISFAEDIGDFIFSEIMLNTNDDFTEAFSIIFRRIAARLHAKSE